jgi:hypothetical protein
MRAEAMTIPSCIRLILLSRYSLLAGLAAPVFIPLLAKFNPALLAGLLVLEEPWQLLHVTWLSLLLATFVLVSFRLTQLAGSVRFADYRESLRKSDAPHSAKAAGWRWRWLLLLAIGLPLPIVCLMYSLDDLSPPWQQYGMSPPSLGAAMISCGTLVALVLLAVLTAAQQLLLDPDVASVDLLPFERWPTFRRLKQFELPFVHAVGRKLALVVDLLGPGYTQKRPDSGQVMLAPGHAQMTLWLAIMVAFYLYSYLEIYSGRRIPSENGQLPALFFLLLWLLLIHDVLAGMAFLLDYYRVPVSVVVLGLSFASTTLFESDHVYELNPTYHARHPQTDAVPPAELDLQLSTVFDNWPLPKRTLVMVSAAGGGIQASAWTTRVLTGLDELYGESFTRSIGVISGVSGGSVGTMYYLAGGDWSGEGPTFNADSREEINANAETSSLEATAWGLAYPDLIRSFAPFLVDRHADRGWAIERSWESRIGQELRLRDWIAPIREHRMPVPIFNATLAETGQRLVISPVLQEPGAAANSAEECEFFNLYRDDDANPLVTTAVRLSATFPYVSPISRAEGMGVAEAKRYHVADGGYAENGGVFTVLDWANTLVERYAHKKRRPFDRILIIRILPFALHEQPDDAKPNQGWTYELLGPIDTIENVRTASQSERNDFDLELLTTPFEEVPVDRDVGGRGDTLPIYWTSFMFEPSDGYVAPLSWHLTTSQKQELRQAWDDLKQGGASQAAAAKANRLPIANRRSQSALTTLDRFFERVD